ncbi:MAG: hypothetical protein CMH64_00490 [Nanoarchaeota archaeon]|nr:hypothetical protein [Nanoarchaeota archaeon]|tara:strand:- start:364 stop:1209 length:846 start_codon:yes stop_codon:yes gene_type:complete
MKVINLLTNELKNLDEITTIKRDSDDFIVSTPHSGIFIPEEFRNNFNLESSILISSDLHTEKVYNTTKGTKISFNLNTAFINPSRPKERNNDKSLPLSLQNDPFSGSSLTKTPLRKKEFSEEEKLKLIKYYDDYHSKFESEIKKIKEKLGYVIIFDGHSMNSIALENTPDQGKERVDFNVGTLDDSSADKRLIDIFMGALKQEAPNYTIQKNFPYKGGFITKKYGNPKENVHVIQIETKRSLFMHEGLNNGPNSFEMKDSLKEITSIFSKVFEITEKKYSL